MQRYIPTRLTLAKANKKPSRLLPGNPAISLRPVAFRPRLATGLALSVGHIISKMPYSCQVFIIDNVIFFLKKFWMESRQGGWRSNPITYSSRPTHQMEFLRKILQCGN
jgi:hypothetical protein